MPSYAEKTQVSPEKSQEQIRATLRRYGADRFGVMEGDGQAAVMFSIEGKSVRMVVDLPDWQDFRFTEKRRQRRTDKQTKEMHDQAIRQRWRALLLSIKAKLEAVEAGISTIETEFLPFMVMPDGQTVADHVLPRLDAAIEEGEMPCMLPLPGRNSHD